MARTSKQGEADAAGNGAGIDGVLDGLENVVKELESGELPLERALERFEEGVRLARKGGQILDAVEARVETLLADRDDVVPLDEHAEEAP
jgi:exodeoxyribonuclease VII small subunit